MKRLSLVVSLISLVVFAVPATAPAKGGKSPAKHCKALRADMGADAFRAAFGGKEGKRALGRCVSAQRKARRDARKRARKACRVKGLRGKAMKRCFRQELAADPAPAPAEFEHAVEECRTDQAEDPEAFTAEYGDGANAFGKCVAHEANDDDEADEPESEPGEDGDVEDSPGEEPEPDEL